MVTAIVPEMEDVFTTTRQAFRQAVTQVADKARTTLPECHGRIDKAVQLVLQGDVELLPDGHARVASQCQGTTVYHLANGSCDCRDYEHAPSHWCKHRIAAGIQRRCASLDFCCSTWRSNSYLSSLRSSNRCNSLGAPDFLNEEHLAFGHAFNDVER